MIRFPKLLRPSERPLPCVPNEGRTTLPWAMAVIAIILSGLVLHLPGILGFAAIAPLDLIYAYAPWNSVRPEDFAIGSNIPSDQFDYVHPTYAYLVESLREGTVPVHTRLMGNGTPFFFNMTHYGSNPVLLGLGVLLGAPAGYTVYLVLLVSLAGLAFFDVLRSYGLHPLAALWGVVMLVFSSGSLTALGIPMSDQMFLAVLIMWGIRRLFLTSRFWLFFPVTLSAYLLLTSPYPPGMLTAAMFLAAFAGMEVIAAVTRRRSIVRPVVIGTASLGVTLLLSLPFLIEGWNTFLSGEGLDVESRTGFYAEWGLNKRAALLGYLPRAFGDAPSDMIDKVRVGWFFDVNYFGLATSVLLFGAVFTVRHYRRAAFFLLGLTAYTIIIFSLYGLYARTLGQLPILSGIRAYTHLYMWIICVAIVSAYGVQTQLTDRLPRLVRILALLIGVVATVLYARHLYAIYPKLAEASESVIPSLHALTWFPVLMLVGLMLYGASRLLPKARSVASGAPGTTLSSTQLAGLTVVAALMVTLYDLLSVSAGVNRTSAAENYFPETAATSWLKEEQGDGKILPLGTTLLGHAHLPYGLRSLAFRGFYNGRTREVFKAFSPDFPDHFAASQYIYPPQRTDLTHPFLTLMGVKYITDLPTSRVLDSAYDSVLMPRNVKDGIDLPDGASVTQFLDVTGSLQPHRFELRFHDVPDAATVQIDVALESTGEALVSTSLGRNRLETGVNGHLVYGWDFPEETTLSPDRLVIRVSASGAPVRIATYSERTGRDWVQRDGENPKIMSLATDLLVRKPDTNLPRPRLAKRFNDGLGIYETLDYRGRVHMPTACETVADADLLARVEQERPDFTKIVMREACPAAGGQAGSATIVTETPGRIDIAIDVNDGTAAAGFLVVGDTYNRGWKATVDGSPVRPFRANYDFIGVDLPNGAQTVVLRYAPRGLWPAVWIAVAMWAVFLLAFAYWAGLAIRSRIQNMPKTSKSATSISPRK